MEQKFKHLEQEQFWQNGAFLRLPEGRVMLWQGPWQTSAEQRPENRQFSIGYMDYFASHLEQVKGSQVEARIGDWLESDILRLDQPEKTGKPLKIGDFSKPESAQFAAGFAEVMQRIQRGEIEKAVPMVTVKATQKPSRQDLQSWIRQVVQGPQHLQAFGFWGAGVGVIGATPEVLFHRIGNMVHTMALAGTLIKDPGGTPPAVQADFMRNPKELREHRLVVEDLRQQLESFGRVEIGQTGLMELPTLFHLHTPVSLQLRENLITPDLAEKLVACLHPTPALGVAPRKYGFRWMQDLPAQAERGVFGAPLVFQLSANESIALVQIRCVRWNQTTTEISAGCGVVEQSHADSEWEEAQRKIQSIYKILGME